MDSGRLIFDSSSSRPGHMLILGGSGSHSIFRGARSILGMEGATNKRRPFFTSPEELLEEEYYDEQLPEKKRRLTPEQVHLLEKSFETENKLEPERKSELAEKLGLQPRQVAVWFQNRRARWKTKTLERDFDRLRAAYDSLLAEHDSLLKDNGGLRSQFAHESDTHSFISCAKCIDCHPDREAAGQGTGSGGGSHRGFRWHRADSKERKGGRPPKHGERGERGGGRGGPPPAAGRRGQQQR